MQNLCRKYFFLKKKQYNSELKFVNDDGSHGLPFRFADNDMVTLVVSANAHNGKLQKGRAILQTITRIERSTGNILRYSRTGINIGGVISWSAWEKGISATFHSI